MIREEITGLTKLAIRRLFPDSVGIFQNVIIEKPSNLQFGDYAINIAFDLAKKLGKPSQEVAEILAEEINKTKPAEIERAEAVGGYVNFFLSNEFLRHSLGEIHKNRKSFGRSRAGKGRTIIVEYSQPNIAKPMHVGHLRTTILGDALANIYEALGYKVIRWNYIGDWGTQFGKLIAAYKLWGSQLRSSAPKYLEAEPLSKKNQITVHDLVSLYVRFHEELKQHPELERRGQEEFAKLEEGDQENRKLWDRFRKESLKEFDKMYGLLGVKFGLTIGESFFEKDLKPLATDLMKRRIAELGEGGAIIIKLGQLNLPPALIQKSDGASLYLTRDIAALKYRIKRYKPAEILYVVGNEQSLHFQQLAAIANVLGLKPEPEHVKYGLILGEDKKKLATREGRAILLGDIIKKAVDLAREITLKKTATVRGPTSDSGGDVEKIAETVALGALKYEILKEHRNSDIVFDWKRMLDFSGNSGPYLQYTYARLANILRKSGPTWKLNFWRSDLQKLSEKSELAIIKHLLEFPDTIVDSATTHLTNNLALYLYELANLANRFYETTPILKDEDVPRRNARLVLVDATSAVLKTGLNLLGIQVLEKI